MSPSGTPSRRLVIMTVLACAVLLIVTATTALGQAGSSGESSGSTAEGPSGAGASGVHIWSGFDRFRRRSSRGNPDDGRGVVDRFARVVLHQWLGPRADGDGAGDDQGSRQCRS